MKKLFLIPLIIAVIAGLIFSSCIKQADTPTPTTAPSPSPSPSPSSTPASITAPKYGGILRYITGGGAPPIGWPADMMNIGFALQCCFDTLLRGDNKGNIYPWLAESYKIADDLKSITFNLRRGVKFHDGSDFNAEVAKWNLDNLINAKKAPNWSSIEIIDEYTIRVNFNQWVCTLPASFSDDSLSVMVSKTAFEKNGVEWMRMNPVSTGPFKFQSYTLDVGMKFVKNPDYWVEGKPYLDGLENIFVTDLATQNMAMLTGEADMMNVEAGKQAADLEAAGLAVKTAMDAGFHLIPDTAHTDSPWANKKVREAVEYAIDREGIAKAFGYGYWQAPYQIPPRSTVIYDPDFPLARKYDLEKSRQLLVEAGYPNGFQTTIINTMSDKNVAVAVQASLAKAGIQVNLDYPDMGVFMSYMGPSGNWPENAALFNPLPPIDINYVGGLQFIFSWTGQSWLRPPELTQAFNTALNSQAPDIKLIRAVTDMMTRDALFIPINEGGGGRAQYPYVHADFNQRSTPAQWNTEDAWLNK